MTAHAATMPAATLSAAAQRDAMRLHSAPCCLLCGEAGDVEYDGLRDRRGGVAGLWRLRRCGACGLAWLDPRPAAEDLPRLYESYYTHDQGIAHSGWTRRREWLRLALLSGADGCAGVARGRWQRWLGRAARAAPVVDEMARLGVMGLEGKGISGARPGRLLDVGCGSGRLLAVMRRAGWQVDGVEPDARAAAVARGRYGVPVYAGELDHAPFRPRSFDAVVLSHVIEHVAEPVELLGACRRLLRPGGRLALSTPNLDSLGHRRFGRHWLHLDAPRHLHLFSAASLAALLGRAGFGEFSVASAAKSAATTWLSSAVRESGRTLGLAAFARGVAFHLGEWNAVRRGVGGGEELFAWAIAPETTEPDVCKSTKAVSGVPRRGGDSREPL